MPSSGGWRTSKFTKDNERNTLVSTADYSIKSDSEQSDDHRNPDSDKTSTMSEVDGRRIYCSGRDLHTIGLDIFSYPDISYLELSPTREASLDFKLNELPAAVSGLKGLRFLIVDTNSLRTLPDELCQLRKLTILVVSNNLLNALPDGIGYMQQLESIHLVNNRIRELPRSIYNLKNLTFLDLTSNKLRQLSENIGQLTELRSLLLYDNRLKIVPDAIGQLKKLTTLWLGRNRLRTLPRTLTKLTQLDWRNHYMSTILDGNPLVNPPLSICRVGFAHIDQWYQQNATVELLALDGVQQSNDGHSSVRDDTTNRLN